MQRLFRMACLSTLICFSYSLCPTRAGEVIIDFDDLPSLDFAVIEQPDGSTDIVFPDKSVVTIPAGVPLDLALPPGVTLADLFPPPGEVPESSPLPVDYSEHATFSTDPGAGLHYFSGGHAVGSSAPNNLTAAIDADAFPYDENLYVDFSNPVNDLSFTISSDNDAGIIAGVVVHHLNGMTVNLEAIGNGNPSDAIPIDLTAYQDVMRIEVVNVTDTFGLSYDDFRFLVEEVPEPASAMLLVLSCLAFASQRQSSH